MKLLLDQNISFRVLKKIKEAYPEASQVRLLGLENKSDLEIWNFAKVNNYAIVTFDADFFDFSILKGHPPKIIWLRTGNAHSDVIAKMFHFYKKSITEFLLSDDACLEIADLQV